MEKLTILSDTIISSSLPSCHPLKKSIQVLPLYPPAILSRSSFKYPPLYPPAILLRSPFRYYLSTLLPSSLEVPSGNISLPSCHPLKKSLQVLPLYPPAILLGVPLSTTSLPSCHPIKEFLQVPSLYPPAILLRSSFKYCLSYKQLSGYKPAPCMVSE